MNKPGTFQKGDPRINRGGRPKKGYTLTDVLKKYAELKDVEIEGQEDPITRKEALAQIVWDMALKERNTTAINLLYNRLDGLPVQAITGELGIIQKSEYEEKLEQMSDEELIENTKKLEKELKEIERTP